MTACGVDCWRAYGAERMEKASPDSNERQRTGEGNAQGYVSALFNGISGEHGPHAASAIRPLSSVIVRSCPFFSAPSIDVAQNALPARLDTESSSLSPKSPVTLVLPAGALEKKFYECMVSLKK